VSLGTFLFIVGVVGLGLALFWMTAWSPRRDSYVRDRHLRNDRYVDDPHLRPR
jgi:hypothetical protein